MAKLSLLIVEDNPELGQLFVEILASDTITIELIRDGLKALEYLGETQPDMVVLDMQLPNVSGDQILKHIRETSGLKSMRVVVVTASAMMAALVENQADLVLIKPISYVQLRGLVNRLLSSNS